MTTLMKPMSPYQSNHGYLAYNVFTENLLYKAMTKMVNDEIHINNLTLNSYSEKDIRKNIVLDLDDCQGWALQWIDDTRFHIHCYQDQNPILPTDLDKIVEVASACLFNSYAGQQVLEKFLNNKYRNNVSFVTHYYD